MKIEIWNDVKAPEVLQVKLIYDGCGVKLIAVDQGGEPRKEGTILRLGPDGKILRYSGVAKDLGLCLDKDTRVQSN